MDLSILYGISYGMYAVGVMDKDTPTGCIINTVCQITSENPILSISMSKKNYTYEVLERSDSFTLSIIHEQIAPEVLGTLGFKSGRNVKKFETIPFEWFHNMPVLKDSCGSLSLSILKRVDMETHVVYFARLIDTKAGNHTNPMTYAYYHKVRKGKAPKNAPTFMQNAVTPAKETVYVCSVCGYEYHGDITKEPDGFVCPVCGYPKQVFVKKD